VVVGLPRSLADSGDFLTGKVFEFVNRAVSPRPTLMLVGRRQARDRDSEPRVQRAGCQIIVSAELPRRAARRYQLTTSVHGADFRGSVRTSSMTPRPRPWGNRMRHHVYLGDQLWAAV
jgi:hypothetical protein